MCVMNWKEQKVSIITVVLNGAKTIEKTIQSVLQQTYVNVEYIVIDGGSTDGTQDIIRQYMDYIDYYISEPDDGIYNAMNKGLSHVTGHVVAFLNSDDWYEVDAVQKVANYFNNSDADIIMGAVNVIQENHILTICKSNMRMIDFGMPCCHQAVFAKRSVFAKIGKFNTKYLICADYDWILRAHQQKIKIECITDILANYCDEGVSHQQSVKLIEEREEISLNNAISNNNTELILQVRQFNHNIKESISKNQILTEVSEKNIEYVKNLLGKDTKYYIWGTGYYGQCCLRLFQLAGVCIQGFIDNNIHSNLLYGYPVISPDNIQNHIIICIATLKYEHEVIQQIREHKITNNFICYSKLREDIFLHNNK